MGKPLIDVASLTSNLGQKSYSPLPEAYKARRKKLTELEREFKKLFKKRVNGTIQKKELARFGSLPREIKAVTITDPTVIFKKKPNGTWDYLKENRWKVKGEPLAPGLKPIESHHIGGLDKYYSKIKGWDDDDIQLLHETLATRGRYLGNHPSNRLQLDSSLHQGRARQNVVWDESIHGKIDAKDLSPAEFDQYIDDLILENITDSDVLPKKSLVPDDVDFINATNEDIDRLGDMLDSDYALADEFTNKPVNKKLLWEGKTKSSRVTNFIKNNQNNQAFWPEDTLEALKNQDLDRIVEIEKQLPGLRETAMQDALKSGKTLKQWQQISRGIFNNPAVKIGGTVLGGMGVLSDTANAYQGVVEKKPMITVGGLLGVGSIWNPALIPGSLGFYGAQARMEHLEETKEERKPVNKVLSALKPGDTFVPSNFEDGGHVLDKYDPNEVISTL